MDELCAAYWMPLYAFARQWGCPPEDAEDATQEFLTAVTAGGLLDAASPDRGRLRTFLLAAFQRDLADLRRRASRARRGGNVRFVSLDAAAAEESLAADILCGGTAAPSPEAAFDRAWGVSCLRQAADRLRGEYHDRGRAGLFEHLRPFLDPAADPDYDAVSHATGLSVNALRQAVFRLRQRLRAVLRQVVADTLAQPTEAAIDAEMTVLRDVLGGA